MNLGILDSSKYLTEHTSDLARLLIMWKHPGTYLDSDVIVQKSLQDFPSNFIFQSRKNKRFASGIMRMEKREIAKAALEYFVKYFSPFEYAQNGPYALTGTITILCNITDVEEIMRIGSCQDFHFLPSSDCYEISVREWRKFFKPQSADEVMMRTRNSSIVHFWNNLSKKLKIHKTSDTAYIRMAKMHCPLTLQNTVNFF